MRKHIYSFALGAAALAILQIALHKPQPKMTNAQVIDAIAWVLDGDYRPDTSAARPPTMPDWKYAIHFGSDAEAMDGVFKMVNGG